MTGSPDREALTIRPATAADAPGIVRAYLDSAEHHARLDPTRYLVPDRDAIVGRYREGRQHPDDAKDTSLTLVAALGDEVVGFVDARLDRSPDAMHREMVFCHIVEIAVAAHHRGHGVGEKLLHAAEEWGRQRGATFASLEYHVENTRAGEFYRRQDYRIAAMTTIKRL